MTDNTNLGKIETVVETVFKDNPSLTRTVLSEALIKVGVTYGWAECLKYEIARLAVGVGYEPR